MIFNCIFLNKSGLYISSYLIHRVTHGNLEIHLYTAKSRFFGLFVLHNFMPIKTYLVTQRWLRVS